jgi:LEA14-like dessication related protein
MNNERNAHWIFLSVICLALSACAGTESLVSAPTVRLTSVELVKVSFSEQTFLLGFEVSNPNVFPLPIEAVKYRVMFDGESFAGGETRAAFTIPGEGDGEFVVSVELDILNRATQITSLLQGGMPDNVTYSVDGSLSVDIPFTRPLSFSSNGVINVQD